MSVRAAALLFGLLALPFHPFWLDFEAVRRGWLLCLLGALCLWRPGLTLGPQRGIDVWLLALTAWGALTGLLALDDGSPWHVLYGALWWMALWLLLRTGRALPWDDWARALAPTLLVVACYGILQAFDLDPIAYYGSSRDPVSTLGNRNVASEFCAVAAAACAAAWLIRPQWLLAAATLLGSVYLGVNLSRSGMVALPLALLALALLTRGPVPRRFLPLGAAAACIALGWLVLPSAQVSPPAATDNVQVTSPSRLEVRREVWKGTLAMAGQRPMVGQGPGQFPVQYPRFRTQREIELSSFGRQFATKVATAHDDYLQVLAEGGVPALLLWLGFLWAAARLCWRGDRAALAPLVAFAALMVVRAPLYNAPAAAVVLWIVGSAGTSAPPRNAGRGLAVGGLGIVLLGLGLPVVLGFTLAAPYLGQAARAVPSAARDPEPLDTGLTLVPFSADLHFLRLQQYEIQEPDAEKAWRLAQPHVDALAELAPFHPNEQLVVARMALAAGQRNLAQRILGGVLAVDPGMPTAKLLQSVMAAGKRQHAQALQVLYRDPHPALRAALPDHLAQLEQFARGLGDETGVRVFGGERLLLAALDAVLLAAESPGDTAMRNSATEKVTAMVKTWLGAEILGQDIRPWIIAAAHFLDLDDRKSAEDYAQYVRGKGMTLQDWQRGLVIDLLPKLRAVPAWSELVR